MPEPVLREDITFERLTRTPDGGGGASESYAAIAGVQPVFAEVKPVPGREDVNASRQQPQKTFLITARFDDVNPLAVTTDDRIKWVSNGDQILNIRTIDNRDMKREWIKIEATLV